MNTPKDRSEQISRLTNEIGSLSVVDYMMELDSKERYIEMFVVDHPWPTKKLSYLLLTLRATLNMRVRVDSKEWSCFFHSMYEAESSVAYDIYKGANKEDFVVTNLVN